MSEPYLPHQQGAFDVVVCGGGAAGIGAAIGAAKAGARVLVAEKYGFLGGAATTSQVLAYCGLFQQGPEPIRAVGGVGIDVLDELRRHGLDAAAFKSETTGNWIVRLEPEVLKHGLDTLLTRHEIAICLHTRVAAVTRTGQRLEAVTLAGMEGRFHVVAEAFVDASGDANLAMLAGIPCRIGDTEGKLQALTMPMRIGGVDPAAPIDREALKAAISAYNREGAYPIARDDGGILFRMPLSGDIWWMIADLPMEEVTSAAFTRAEIRGRAMAHDYIAMLRRSLPAFRDAHLVATGPQIGVRETRHPRARYELTRQDAVRGRLRDDAIARAAWPIETHGEAGHPAYTPIGGKGYFHVPYGAIHAEGLENLWYGGRVIGADPDAYGSVRVMGTAFATGEAAGVAAADYVARSRRIDLASVQARLAAQGAML